MIELRGLHLGNIARSPDESVRPDLWPDHAWVPALGCTGGVVYDLCGGRKCQLTAPAWFADGLGSNGSSSCGIISGMRPGPDIRTISFRASFVSLPATGIIIESGNSFNLVANSFAIYSSNAYLHGAVHGVAGVVDHREEKIPITIGKTNDYSIVLNNATVDGDVQFFVDGVLASSSIVYQNKTIYGAFGSYPIFLFARNSNSLFSHVQMQYLYVHAGQTKGLERDLHADPLLPFRLRRPVYYSVPSGGDPEPPVSNETPAAMMMGI